MIYTKRLKNVEFTWNTEMKTFTIQRTHPDPTGDRIDNYVALNKSEAGALQRFIFSMYQFYSHPKKKVAKAKSRTKKVEKPIEGQTTLLDA